MRSSFLVAVVLRLLDLPNRILPLHRIEGIILIQLVLLEVVRDIGL